jgi:hypothetical protein
MSGARKNPDSCAMRLHEEKKEANASRTPAIN